MPDSRPQDLTGVVLCGGRGRRMDGLDKGLVEARGQPLVGHVLGRLRRCTGSVIISANRNLARYRAFGVPVVEDLLDDRGPLAGIHAAALAADTDWLFVCPGDAPGLDPALPGALRAALGDAPAVHALGAGRSQPLHLLVRTALARTLGTRLAAGPCPVVRWLEEIGSRARAVDVADATWLNLNTPDELAAWRDAAHDSR